MEQGGNCFLLRYSEVREMYLLTVMTRKSDNGATPSHFELKVMKEGKSKAYEIDGSERKFTNIFDMLAFYKRNPINQLVETLGDVCLNMRVLNMKDYVLEELFRKTALKDTKLPIKGALSHSTEMKV